MLSNESSRKGNRSQFKLRLAELRSYPEMPRISALPGDLRARAFQSSSGPRISLALGQKGKEIKPLLCINRTRDFAEVADQAKTRFSPFQLRDGAKLER